MSYSLEQKVSAREAFVESDQTYEEVAAATGISPAALKAWGKEGNWQKEREEFQKGVLAVNGKVQKLKMQLLDEAIAGGDPQKIYALANLMRVSAAGKAVQSGVDSAALFLKWAQQLIDYLQDKDQEALRYLQPHIRSFAESVKTQSA
jgi:hypothetical protein